MPQKPCRYNNEQTTKQTKAINNSYIYIYHVNVTQTVPDISPLMPMHQDPLLVTSLWSTFTYHTHDPRTWTHCITGPLCRESSYKALLLLYVITSLWSIFTYHTHDPSTWTHCITGPLCRESSYKPDLLLYVTTCLWSIFTCYNYKIGSNKVFLNFEF